MKVNKIKPLEPVISPEVTLYHKINEIIINLNHLNEVVYGQTTDRPTSEAPVFPTKSKGFFKGIN